MPVQEVNLRGRRRLNRRIVTEVAIIFRHQLVGGGVGRLEGGVRGYLTPIPIRGKREPSEE